MLACLTADLNADGGGRLRAAYRGVAEATPQLATLLAEECVPATFFATSNVACEYSSIVRQLVEWGHELGVLGDDEHQFDRLAESELRLQLHATAALVRRYYPAVSYRAAGLRSTNRYLPLLEAENFLIDSSQAKFRPGYWIGMAGGRLLRVPVSASFRTILLPSVLRVPILRALASPVVLHVHPTTIVTRPMALARLRSTIRFFKHRGFRFVRVEDLLPHDKLTCEMLGTLKAAHAAA